MLSLVWLLHIIFCIVIIALVLLQQGKGADVGAAFGSGSANSMFGSRGPASFLFKLTVFFAVLFFISSISLTYLQSEQIKTDNALALPPAPLSTAPLSGSNAAGFLPPAATTGS